MAIINSTSVDGKRSKQMLLPPPIKNYTVYDLTGGGGGGNVTHSTFLRKRRNCLNK